PSRPRRARHGRAAGADWHRVPHRINLDVEFLAAGYVPGARDDWLAQRNRESRSQSLRIETDAALGLDLIAQHATQEARAEAFVRRLRHRRTAAFGPIDLESARAIRLGDMPVHLDRAAELRQRAVFRGIGGELM